jgi:hypothetical protein
LEVLTANTDSAFRRQASANVDVMLTDLQVKIRANDIHIGIMELLVKMMRHLRLDARTIQNLRDFFFSAHENHFTLF